MKQYEVRVSYNGTVTVLVPDHMNDEDAELLAGKLAVCKILATVNNPDSPDDAVCEEYKDECSPEAAELAEEDWDASKVYDGSGDWYSLATRSIGGDTDVETT